MITVWLSRLIVTLSLSILFVACDDQPPDYGREGDEPGDCSDEIDNDSDELVDCEDDDCVTDPACDGADGDGDGDSDGDGEGDVCLLNVDCDDDVFCNGEERCAPGDSEADDFGCLPAETEPCPSAELCNEVEDRCLSNCDENPDVDGDGHDSSECGGDDCDDFDADRYPGNTEVCDSEGHDEDCNPDTLGSDDDSDGFVHDDCCNGERCGRDCDDGNREINPEATEVCNTIDEDCDGEVDEGVLRTFYFDGDGDGFGNPTGPTVEGCVAIAGYVENDADCDDEVGGRNPGQAEVCDLIGDNDCDPSENPFDNDGDGYERETCGGNDCDDTDAATYPGAPELCDGIDNNCSSGGVDPSEDADDDGYAPIGASCSGGPFPPTDCDDAAPDRNPGRSEVCDGVDNDCDDEPDEVFECVLGSSELCSFFVNDNEIEGTRYCLDDCSGLSRCMVTFTMGSPAEEVGRLSNETQHEVTLTHSFWIQETEVTQSEFEAVMGFNPSNFTGCGGDCPVERVRWHEAAAYCNALSVDAGLPECFDCTGSGTSVSCEPAATYASPYNCPGYRLPTEAEWEYAARSGTTSATYNGELDETLCSMSIVLNPIAWYCGNSEDMTHPVAGLEPNNWGLYDILGNVWEWCHDWEDDYPSGGVTDPFGPETGRNRVFRGSSWPTTAGYTRAAFRGGNLPGFRGTSVGFRPVQSLP